LSNDYFDYSGTFLAGALARAEEVAQEFVSIQVGFDLLPQPRPDGTGFLTPFYVADPTEDNHAANWGTLKALEISAQSANTSALAAESNITDTLLPDVASKHSDVGTWHSDVSTWRTDTATYRTEAQTAAQQATLAASGAREWQEGWDASGGALPIPTPVEVDAGKYWRITVDGTLPQVGAVVVEDELSIKADLTYEILPANLAVQSVAGRTGVVTLTKSDVGLNNVQNYGISDSLVLNSSGSYASSKAVRDVNALVTTAQTTANTAVTNAATAQDTADTAVTNAATAQGTADTAVTNAATAQSTADGAVTVNGTQAASITSLGNRITALEAMISKSGSTITLHGNVEPTGYIKA
jgi:hypothetical protein